MRQAIKKIGKIRLASGLNGEQSVELHHIEEITKGIAEADRNEFASDQEVREFFERWTDSSSIHTVPRT